MCFTSKWKNSKPQFQTIVGLKSWIVSNTIEIFGGIELSAFKIKIYSIYILL